MRIARGWALIFDLDGVVIDSMPLHTEAWRLYLNQLGISSNGIEARMHGRRNDNIVREYIGSGLTDAEVFAHGAAKERLFREMMQPRLKEHLVPGVVQFLACLDGVPVGLASNAERANIDFVLDGTGLRPRFDVIVDGHQVRRPKPYPDVYLRAAELLETDPEKCLVFEDSPAGVEAGLAAGAKVAGVRTHTNALPGVDVLIRDFSDPALGAWIERLPALS